MFSQLWKGQQNFLRHIFILAKKKTKQINYTSLVFYAQFFHSPSAFSLMMLRFKFILCKM